MDPYSCRLLLKTSIVNNNLLSPYVKRVFLKD